VWVAGYLAELQGDILDARARLEAGISAARDTGDIRAIAYASTYLGPVLYSLREPARGHAVTEIALRLHRKNADQFGVALTATVVLSFAAALGVSAFFFNHVFGFGGAATSFPLFVFVFLVALGIDYNIFLMTRVREEAIRRDARHGAIIGLAATGGVITSAGFVLAGTFAVLATIPSTQLTEIGFAVAVRHPARHDHRAVRAGYRAQPGPRSVDVVASRLARKPDPAPAELGRERTALTAG